MLISDMRPGNDPIIICKNNDNCMSVVQGMDLILYFVPVHPVSGCCMNDNTLLIKVFTMFTLIHLFFTKELTQGCVAVLIELDLVDRPQRQLA